MAAAFDVFPREHSAALNFEIASKSFDTFDALARDGRVHAFVVYQEVGEYQRIFHRPFFSTWYEIKQLQENFKRCYQASKTCQPFVPEHIRWERVSKKLLHPPEHEGKNTDPRLGFKCLDYNVFLVKSYFTFGYRKVGSLEQHLFQTTQAPLLCYVLPSSSVDSKAQPCTIRRNFTVEDQHLYKRHVFLPHSFYLVPPGTHYIVMSLQKTVFKVDVLPIHIKIEGAYDCRMHTKYVQTSYRLPPPTPAHEVQYEVPECLAPPATPPCPKNTGSPVSSVEDSHVNAPSSLFTTSVESPFKSPFLPPPAKKRHVSQAPLLSMPRVSIEETNSIIYDAPTSFHTILPIPTLPSVELQEPLPVNVSPTERTLPSNDTSCPSDETMPNIILSSEYETISPPPAVSLPQEEATEHPVSSVTASDKTLEELEEFLCAFESEISKQTSPPENSSQDTSVGAVSELTLPEEEDLLKPFDSSDPSQTTKPVKPMADLKSLESLVSTLQVTISQLNQLISLINPLITEKIAEIAQK